MGNAKTELKKAVKRLEKAQKKINGLNSDLEAFKKNAAITTLLTLQEKLEALEDERDLAIHSKHKADVIQQKTDEVQKKTEEISNHIKGHHNVIYKASLLNDKAQGVITEYQKANNMLKSIMATRSQSKPKETPEQKYRTNIISLLNSLARGDDIDGGTEARIQLGHHYTRAVIEPYKEMEKSLSPALQASLVEIFKERSNAGIAKKIIIAINSSIKNDNYENHIADKLVTIVDGIKGFVDASEENTKTKNKFDPLIKKLSEEIREFTLPIATLAEKSTGDIFEFYKSILDKIDKFVKDNSDKTCNRDDQVTKFVARQKTEADKMAPILNLNIKSNSPTKKSASLKKTVLSTKNDHATTADNLFKFTNSFLWLNKRKLISDKPANKDSPGNERKAQTTPAAAATTTQTSKNQWVKPQRPTDARNTKSVVDTTRSNATKSRGRTNTITQQILNDALKLSELQTRAKVSIKSEGESTTDTTLKANADAVTAAIAKLTAHVGTMIKTSNAEIKHDLQDLEDRIRLPLPIFDIDSVKKTILQNGSLPANADLKTLIDSAIEIDRQSKDISTYLSNMNKLLAENIIDLKTVESLREYGGDNDHLISLTEQLQSREKILKIALDKANSEAAPLNANLKSLKSRYHQSITTALASAFTPYPNFTDSTTQRLENSKAAMANHKAFSTDLTGDKPDLVRQKIKDLDTIANGFLSSLADHAKTRGNINLATQLIDPHKKWLNDHSFSTTLYEKMVSASRKLDKQTVDGVKALEKSYDSMHSKLDTYLRSMSDEDKTANPEKIAELTELRDALQQRVSQLSVGTLDVVYGPRDTSPFTLPDKQKTYKREKLPSDSSTPAAVATAASSPASVVDIAAAASGGIGAEVQNAPSYMIKAAKLRGIASDNDARWYLAGIARSNVDDRSELIRNPNLSLRFKINDIALKTWKNKQTPQDKKINLVNLTLAIVLEQLSSTRDALEKIEQKFDDPLTTRYLKTISEHQNSIRLLQIALSAKNPEPDTIARAIKLLRELQKTPSDLDRFGNIMEFAAYLNKQAPVKPADNSKIALRKAFDAIPDMNQYFKVGSKEGGVNQPGKFGGVYVYPYIAPGETKPRLQRILFKQDTKGEHIHHDKNIAEVMAGRIMNAVIDDSASSVFFATDPTPDGRPSRIPNDTGESVYIGSIFYDEYDDLFKELGFEYRPYDVGNINKAEFNKGFVEKGKDGKEICKFDDFDKVTAASALVGDFDIHTGNFGVIGKSGTRKKLVKIDHGGALRGLEDDIHIHSHTRHIPGMGPSNHFREYPRDLKVNPQFAAELDRQSSPEAMARIRTAISTTLDELNKFYGVKPIADFAKFLGMELDGSETKTRLLTDMNTFLSAKMEARQQSQKELSMEIKLSLSVKKMADGKFAFDESIYHITDLIYSNPAYFLKGDFHFRGKGQRTAFGPIKIKAITDAELEKLVNRAVTSSVYDLVVRAEKELNPQVIEYILCNPKMASNFTPEGLVQLKKVYQAILDSIASNLTETSRRLFVEFTDPDKTAYTDERQPLSHKLMSNAGENLVGKITQDILSEKSLEHRVLVVERWIAIMTRALDKNDYNTATLILQALKQTDIARLESTFANLSKNAADTLNSAYAKIDVGNPNGAKMQKLVKDVITSEQSVIPMFFETKQTLAKLHESTKHQSANPGPEEQKQMKEMQTFISNMQRQQQSNKALLKTTETYKELTKDRAPMHSGIDHKKSLALEPAASPGKRIKPEKLSNNPAGFAFVAPGAKPAAKPATQPVVTPAAKPAAEPAATKPTIAPAQKQPKPVTPPAPEKVADTTPKPDSPQQPKWTRVSATTAEPTNVKTETSLHMPEHAGTLFEHDNVPTPPSITLISQDSALRMEAQLKSCLQLLESIMKSIKSIEQTLDRAGIPPGPTLFGHTQLSGKEPAEQKTTTEIKPKKPEVK